MSHIMVWRGSGAEDSFGGFWHHGILCSDGTVIHYTGMDGPKTFHNASILRTSLSEFNPDANRQIHHVSYSHVSNGCVYSPIEVERRAETRLGQATYHVVYDNCESFARWCVCGQETSFQGKGIVFGALAGMGSLLAGAGLLGAGLTAVVVQKVWDGRGNRSERRREFGEGSEQGE